MLCGLWLHGYIFLSSLTCDGILILKTFAYIPCVIFYVNGGVILYIASTLLSIFHSMPYDKQDKIKVLKISLKSTQPT